MKLSIGAVVLVASLVTPLVAEAQDPALSANVGFVSQYLFRGIPQSSTASGNGGLDFTVSKFYAGAWAADVSEGTEMDLYLGVGDEWGDFSASLGGTWYLYSSDAFDRPYLEGNLNVGYNIVSAEFSYGRHDVEPGENYWFFAATVEKWGLYGTVGVWGDDADGANFKGEYFEGGYGVSVSDLDLSVAWIYGNDTLLETIGGLGPPSDKHTDNTIVFGLSYAFDIDLD